MPVISLSQEFVSKHLHCPEGKTRIEYCSDDIKGLYIEVRASNQGTGTAYFRYTDPNGITRHHHIGKMSDIDLNTARKLAKKVKAEISLGADPRGAERARQEIPTLQQFWDGTFLNFIKHRKRSWTRDVELSRRLLEAFGNKRLNEITREQLIRFHTSLLDEELSPASANHHMKLIRALLFYALSLGIIDKNVAARFPMFAEENKIENYLNPEELQRLMKVLTTHDNLTVARICIWLLSTGARCGEALKAEWKDIDRTNRIWRIPASNSKSRRVRAVPIPDTGLEILEQLNQNAESRYLFPSPKTEGLPYTTIAKSWARIRKLAGLEHLRIHDLRHQYASFLVNSGRTLYEVQTILGHSDAKVTQRYAHLSTRSLQDAANSASIILKGAMPVQQAVPQ